MEAATESRSDHGRSKKMVIKTGGRGGGIIGAVVLLGGALATAALASAFAVHRKRRSSGGGGDDSFPEIKAKSEDTRGNEEVDLEKNSTVIISDQSLKLDDEAKVETDDGFVEDERVELTKEEVSEREVDGDGGMESKRDEEDNVVEGSMEKKELEVLCNGNGETDEEKCVEKTILPVFEAPPPIQEDDDSTEAIHEEALEEAKENHRLDDSIEVEGTIPPFMDGSNEEDPKTLMHDEESKKEVAKEDEEDQMKHEEVEATMVEGEIAETTDKVIEKKILLQFAVLHQQQEQEQEQEEEEEGEGEGEGDSSMKEEKSVDSSNWEALWQAEPAKEVKLIDYEMGGKIQEDPIIYEKPIVAEGKCRFIAKDHQTSSRRQRLIIWTLCVLSSLSCSWFFDLSTAKLCLVAFLTVFLLEIYGFSLRNHAAKGERS